VNRRIQLFRGRLVAYIEPRDIWVGVYVAEDYVYVCPLPLCVIRIDRDWSL
jgi:hypothetical protein